MKLRLLLDRPAPWSLLLLFPALGLAAGDESTRSTIDGAPLATAAHPATPSLAGLGRALDAVVFDEPGDGLLWTRGRHWKMSFGAGGASYLAAFSRELPHLELEISPADVLLDGRPLSFAAEPRVSRRGERVELDRGAFVEAYELGLEAVEQLFVFPSLPRRGALELRIPLPAVQGAEVSAEGLHLSTHLGEIRYSHAIAFDARGRRTDAPTTFEDGAIVIRVDADFVRSAALPLVIDPILTQTALDVSASDFRDPDVVYDSQHGLWLAVYRETFSATDWDVRVSAVNSAGFVVLEGYIDLSPARWSKPRIAHLADFARALCVAEVGPDLSRSVRGRILRPNGAILEFGTQFTISNDSHPGEKFAPTVGGDPSLIGPAWFCVAFQRERIAQVPNYEIQYAQVTYSGQVVLGPYSVPAGGVRDIQPSLSRSNGHDRWTLAFQRVDPVSQGDIMAAYISVAGVLSPVFGVTAGASARDSAPSASSPLLDGGRSLIAFERRTGFSSQADIIVVALADGVVVDSANLSVLEGLGTQARDQVEPSIDSDGHHIAVSYAESLEGSTTDYAVRLSTLFLAGHRIGVREAHFELVPVGLFQRVPKVAAARVTNTPLNKFCATFHSRFSDTDYDIWTAQWGSLPGGTVVPYCFGDGSGTDCPCGNSPIAGRGCPNSANPNGALLIGSTGAPSLTSDDLVLWANGIPAGQPGLFFQGTNELAGVVFGEGLRCAGGLIVRLKVKAASAAGTMSFPELGDLPLSVAGGVPALGGMRTYQVWYRDPGAFCGSSDFNLTNGLRVLWAY